MRLTRARGEVLWTAAAAVLVATFLALALRHVDLQDATYDERFYFGAGRTILRDGNWDGVILLHPPLSYYVASLPLLRLEDAPSAGDAYLLLLARLASLVAFGVPLLVGVLFWARELYGRAAALVALALAAFSPTLLAHAPLLTPDAALTATGFFAVYLYWRGRGRSVVPWALALGLALLSKASALLFIPVLGALALVWARKGGVAILRRTALGFVLSWIVLLAGYGFEGLFDWEAKRAMIAKVPPSPALRAAAWTAAPFFPVPYLRTIGRQSHVGIQGRASYLMGEISNHGFPHYYLVALVLKETVPFLLLLAAAAASLFWSPPRARDEPALLLPPAVFFLLFSLGAVQIGIRYVLPALPFLFVFAARLARPMGSGRASPVAAGAAFILAAAHALATLRGGPDYLSYFNAIAGGPDNGYRYLGDSNLDWGQNRSRAEEYARGHGAAFQPLVVPPHGLVVLSTNRVQGFMDPPRYRLLRDEYEPVDRVGHNWFVYDLARNRRFPEGSMVPVLSGPSWRGGPPVAGWADTGFDDRGWPAAEVTEHEEFALQSAFPGTAARYVTCAGGLDDCALRYAFDLGGPPAQAMAYMASHGAYELHVNGRLAARGQACAPALQRDRHSLPATLQAGRNVIALRVSACGDRRPLAFFEMRVAPPAAR
jgi:4-amino-4-deoxy-L-arabinose transferase-like glycosyltransferase